MKTGRQAPVPDKSRLYYYSATFRAAAFRGRRERSLRLFLVAWEGHQANKKAK